ncbi:MAG: ATP12 family protein [Alphaproteobacteria bacterium]|nr:ATP12 family protein [Alphaproteobacteria bacterium]
MKRFYETVDVVAAEPGFQVRLDDKPILTPGKAALVLPTRVLADAIAAEWSAQADDIRPETMPFLKLANTALDRVAPRRRDVVKGLAGYGESDLVCYLAEEPAGLVRRQEELWRPLRAWIHESHGVDLASSSGIVHVAQDSTALAKLHDLVEAHGDFALTVLAEFVTITGSIVIALALAEGAIDLEAAWAAAFVDELHQAERWGHDEAAAERRQRLKQELAEALGFLELLGA